MVELLATFAECFMTGIVAGLTIWVLAKLGLIPILLVTYTDDEKDNKQ